MTTQAERAEGEDTGEVIASIRREGFRGGADGELRVSLDTYEGNQFVSIRLWLADREGTFRPTKKGCSVRLSEAHEVAAAITVAVAMSGRGPSAPARTYGPSAGHPRPGAGRRASSSAGAPRPEAPRPEAPRTGWYAGTDLPEPRRRGPERPVLLSGSLDEVEAARRGNPPWE